jgi:hypothetical protein
VRGVREPDVDPHWSPPALTLDGGVWSPGRADVQRFMPAVTEHRRAVLVEGEDGESQQTFFTIGKLPKTSDFPGNAELLFAPLERLDFPVDAVAHVRWVVNKKMLAICDNSIKDARDELDDAAARFLSRRVRQRVKEVADVQEYFESEPFPPGLETFISFAVSAGGGSRCARGPRYTAQARLSAAEALPDLRAAVRSLQGASAPPRRRNRARLPARLQAPDDRRATGGLDADRSQRGRVGHRLPHRLHHPRRSAPDTL